MMMRMVIMPVSVSGLGIHWRHTLSLHIQDNCQQWRCRDLDTCEEHRTLCSLWPRSLVNQWRRWKKSYNPVKICELRLECLNQLNCVHSQMFDWFLKLILSEAGILSNNTGPVTVITRMNIHWYYLANRCLRSNEKWWKFNKNVDDKVLICTHTCDCSVFPRAWVLMSHSWG